MEFRAYRPEDAPGLAALSASAARGETDFVLNPLWEIAEDLIAEFERFGIDPESHIVVADAGEGVGPVGLAGFLRRPGDAHAGLLCPIVRREERGQGTGGQLLRAALEMGSRELGITLAAAAIGTRNRAGYTLLTAHGFRPVRQVWAMRCDTKPKGDVLPIEGVVAEPARAEDAQSILDIYLQCGFEPRSLERMQEVLGDGRHDHTVARDASGAVCAFVELETHWPRRVWVAFVGVPPDLRDRGLGSTLVGNALERRFDAGAVSALLALSPANRTAVRAYEKVGFRRHRLLDVLEKPL